MKHALLPLVLLALSLPEAALAHPADFPDSFGPIPGPSMVPVYRLPTVLPGGQPGYGALPWMRPTLPQPRYGIANGYGQSYGVPTPGYGYGYGYGPSQPPIAPYRPLPRDGYGQPGITYDYGYGYGRPAPYGLAEVPAGSPPPCRPNPARVLMGAAIGGLSSAALAPNGRTRSWAVPVGAALGGIGALATSC